MRAAKSPAPRGRTHARRRQNAGAHALSLTFAAWRAFALGGVLEFIAQEGMVYLPFWMMENMHLNEGDVLHLRSASIPKGDVAHAQGAHTQGSSED